MNLSLGFFRELKNPSTMPPINGISTKKIKVFGLLFCFVFDLHYLCFRIVGISLLQQSEKHGYIYKQR